MTKKTLPLQTFTISCLTALLLLLTAATSVAQNWRDIALSRAVTHPQPMTGLVLWPDEAEDRNEQYGNEECWNAIGKGIRWKTGVCGGEISYYSSKDQKNFLSPEGLYGHTWSEQAAKYHITFMIANDAPRGGVATPQRFKEGSMATGYHFVVESCQTDGTKTRLLVTNTGVAPLYRDAWFAIGDVRSTTTLRGLQPGEERWVEIQAVPDHDASNLNIVSDYILPQQTIEFDANLQASGMPAVTTPAHSASYYYNLSGQRLTAPQKGVNIHDHHKAIAK